MKNNVLVIIQAPHSIHILHYPKEYSSNMWPRFGRQSSVFYK